jgi:hypothetical protein
MPSRFRTPADGLPRPVITRRVRWLGEPVAGSVAAGGMQPKPMFASEPGGQATAKLGADVGHRQAGERAGFLEADVVDLEPGDLAVLPAANDRLGDLVGVDADLGPGVLGPGAQLTGQVGDKHQVTGVALRVAGEQLIDQATGRLGNPGVQQGTGADDEDGAGLGFASREQ